MTDPYPNILKSAAAYLVQVACSSKGGRYRRSAKIETLREWKEEILEAHRSAISTHRIAQIFRAQSGSKKGVEAELSRERRRAQRADRQKGSSSGRDRSEKQRSGPSR